MNIEYTLCVILQWDKWKDGVDFSKI